MDEDEDNWSYSLPASVDDLLNLRADLKIKDTGSFNTIEALSERVTETFEEKTFRDQVKNYSSTDLRKFQLQHEKFVHSNNVSADQAVEGETLEPAKYCKNTISNGPEISSDSDMICHSSDANYVDDGQDGQKSKPLRFSLQPAVLLKLAPADPQTTREDANLIISKENASNALALEVIPASQKPAQSSLKNDLKDSVKIWQQRSNEHSTDLQHSEQALECDISEAGSPKIITYRKTTHTRKVSNSLKTEDQAEKFDPKLYVNERFKHTRYRYATMKRNVEFHQIFKTIDLTDRLLDDFACAISREILLQGRLYLTENHLCFNSNLLGWITTLVVPISEIIRIDKKSTAGLFPNGIIVETRTDKHNFASFLSRDATYDFMRTIWLATTGKNISELELSPLTEPLPSEVSEKRISDYIMSIDEGENVDSKWNDGEFEDSEDESSDIKTNHEESNHSEAAFSVVNSETEQKEFRTLRPDSMYKAEGPYTHIPTSIPIEIEEMRQETEVVTDVVDAPMGIVFEILFGQTNLTFHKRFLTDQGASEISAYEPFQPILNTPSSLERSYTYQRPLGYSIGPKSTQCCVREVVEHCNFDDYVVVLSITDTPDVPSGGSFSVWTRFYLCWSERNSTKIKIAYHIEWKGRSWIKSMVEKLTLSAQVSVSENLIYELKKEVESQTYLTLNTPKQCISHKTDAIVVPPPTGALQPATTIIKETQTDSHSQPVVVYFAAGILLVSFMFIVHMYFNIMVKLNGVQSIVLKQQELLETLSDVLSENQHRY